MIQKIVDAIIKTQMEEHDLTAEDEKIYRYGYILLCEVILNILIAFIIGFLFRDLETIFFFLFMYIPLRSFCGGWHADKIWKCTIISNVILLLLIYGKRLILQNVTVGMMTVFFVLCFVSIICIAPIETVTKKISESERRIYKKRIYCIIFIQCVVFFILALLGVKEYAFSLAYVYVVQIVMLLLELTKKKITAFCHNDTEDKSKDGKKAISIFK